MTNSEKTAKLLGYSLIIKPADKKTWQDALPKMDDKQVQVLYGVLVDEVKAWKREGISILQDNALEIQLLPTPEHGASLDTLKARLAVSIPKPAVAPAPPVPAAKSAPVPAPAPVPVPSVPKHPEHVLAQSAAMNFAKEMKTEVTRPELVAHKDAPPVLPKQIDKPPVLPPKAPVPPPTPVKKEQPAEEEEEEAPEDDLVLGKFQQNLPSQDKNAWMLSSSVVVPRGPEPPAPKTMAIPKIRNRVARHGMGQLSNIRTVDDLRKIEAAHLRQGPLRDQIIFIKQRILQLAREHDMLPVSLIPVFEQSYLFQTYLKAGSMTIETNSGTGKYALDQVMAEMESMGEDTLSQLEFEAMADLRKELEAIAGL